MACCPSFDKLANDEFIYPTGADDEPDCWRADLNGPWLGGWTMDCTSDKNYDPEHMQVTLEFCPKCGKKLEIPANG